MPSSNQTNNLNLGVQHQGSGALDQQQQAHAYQLALQQAAAQEQASLLRIMQLPRTKRAADKDFAPCFYMAF